MNKNINNSKSQDNIQSINSEGYSVDRVSQRKLTHRKSCNYKKEELNYKQKYYDLKEKKTDVDKLLKLFAKHLKHCPGIEEEISKCLK